MNTMLAVIIAFMPPTGIHLYLPLIFKLWEAVCVQTRFDLLLNPL
jgi:hypothetical protein